MVELAYTAVSNTAAREGLRVRIPLRARTADGLRSAPTAVGQRRQRAARAGVVAQVLDRHGERHRPVGRSWSRVPGRFGRSATPQQVLERGRGQRGRARPEAAVDRLGHLGDRPVGRVGRRAARAAPTSRPGRSAPRHIPARVGRSWVVTMARACRGQASGGSCSNQTSRVERIPVRGELVAEARLDRAEVLADDDGRRPGALEGDQLEQLAAARSARRRRRPGAPPSGTQNRRVSPITWSMRRPPPARSDARRRSASGR